MQCATFVTFLTYYLSIQGPPGSAGDIGSPGPVGRPVRIFIFLFSQGGLTSLQPLLITLSHMVMMKGME